MASNTSPLFAGNRGIAKLIKSGDCRMGVFGDSIFGNSTKGRLISAVMRCWRPDRWVGVASITSGDTDAMPMYGGSGAITFGDNSGLISLTDGEGKSPKSLSKTTFNGVATGADTAWYTNQFLNDDMDHGAYFNGEDDPWWENALTYRGIFYGTPSENFNGMLRFSQERNPGNANRATSNALNVSLVTGMTYVDLAIPANTGRPMIRVLAPASTTMTNGKTVEMVGGRWFRPGVSGFQLDVMLQAGGYIADYWNDTANVSDVNFAAYHAAMGTNLFYINTMQNGAVGETLATYQASIEALIARCKTAVPDSFFVLATSHDTGTQRILDKADVLYQITQSRSDTLFLNIQKCAGSFDHLKSAYTFTDAPVAEQQFGLWDADGLVHPNARGSVQIALASWALIEQAITSRAFSIGGGVSF